MHHHSSFLKICNTIVREGFLKKNDVIPGTRCNLFEKWFSDPDLFYFRLDKEKVLDRKRNWSFDFCRYFMFMTTPNTLHFRLVLSCKFKRNLIITFQILL